MRLILPDQVLDTLLHLASEDEVTVEKLVEDLVLQEDRTASKHANVPIFSKWKMYNAQTALE